MHVRFLSRSDLMAAVDMPAAIDAMEGAFAALSRGDADVPLRTPIETEDGVSLFMPAMVPLGSGSMEGAALSLGAKVVSVFPGNAEVGLPAILALVLLIDPRTGAPLAVMEGAWLTALRTGAGSGLATRYLARADARVLGVLGAGTQARTQIEAVRCVRDIEEVRIYSPGGRSAARLAAELVGVEARAVDAPSLAVSGCDVVVTATSSQTPVLSGRDAEPGLHVNAIGSFTPDMQEVDEALVRRAKVFVDQREAAWAEAGDLIIPRDRGLIDERHVLAEIGELVQGLHPGRSAAEDITFYKSVGSAVQDLAVASLALRRAEERDLGMLLSLD